MYVYLSIYYVCTSNSYIYISYINTYCRRERNRMHAKMTRDRKKSFIASLKRVIIKLEGENQRLREELDKARADESLNASSGNDRNTKEDEEYAYTSPLPRVMNHAISTAPTTRKISPPISNQPFYTVG